MKDVYECICVHTLTPRHPHTKQNTGNVQVLAFCQPPDAVRRALLGMCRLLRRMRAHLTQEEVRGFVPRVVELGREVRTVVGMMGVALDKGEEGSLLEELDLGNLSPTGEC